MKVKTEELTLELLNSIGNEEVLVEHNNECFYFKFDIKKHSSALAVHTNGAIDFNKKEPPVFQRYTWAKDIPSHCIFIDDRTLHNVSDENFNTAWLIGTRDREYIRDYSEIVKIIQLILNIGDEEVFYWGSSAGGTSSIALATLHKGSTAIANNPQTNILNDYPRRRDAIFRNVFTGLEVEEVTSKFYHRLSLVGLMNYENYVPKMYYIQNNSHLPDIHRHMNPFIEEIKSNNIEIDGRLIFWLYFDSSKGHTPLSREKTLEYLKTIMSYKYL